MVPRKAPMRAQHVGWRRGGAHLLAVSYLASVTACGSHYVTRGADLYAGGNFVQAAEVFEHTERRLSDESVEGRARYGLYRGATLLALGETRGAHRWLTYAIEAADRDASALTDEEHVMLKRALGALQVAEPPANSSLASALVEEKAASSASP